MATRKSNGGTGNRNRSTNTGSASVRRVTNNVPLRQPTKSDSTGYKVLYAIVTLVIVVGLFAWQNGYLDRFLVGTPFEEYATGATVSGGTVSGISADYADIDTNWDESIAPNYYQVIGEAHTDHEDELQWGEIVYTGLDDLGRTREVYGKLTADMYFDSKGWRAVFEAGTDRVSGWGHNRKVEYTRQDGRTVTVDAYNRSHLVADSIGGASNINNVITGTRMQNTGEDNKGGMCYTEIIARDWFEAHEGDTANYIYYCAYPVYVGNEIVPRLVVVDIKTSTGEISERVVTYNYMRGFQVDYNTGEIFEK